MLIPLLLSTLLAANDSTTLVALNRGYVDAFMHSDAAWYDAHLAPDYTCFAPDGSIISRAAIVAGAKQPMSYKSFSLDSVAVVLVGDVALISAITPYVRADGTSGASRYTAPGSNATAYGRRCARSRRCALIAPRRPLDTLREEYSSIARASPQARAHRAAHRRS